MKTDYAGIDYSMGKSNQNGEFHYGVIHSNEVGQYWFDDSEPEYGDESCPSCGSEDIKETSINGTLICNDCNHQFDEDMALPDEPLAFHYNAEGYEMVQSYDDVYPDIFITKSPYYTYAQFCSPCAPSAGYLMNYTDPDVGVKTYCLGHDWFEPKETGKYIDCEYCKGTGLRRIDDNFNLETFKANGGKQFDDNRVFCWVCHKNHKFGLTGKVKEKKSKAPYPVYSVETDELIES